ncbi:MAG: nitroreductase family protein [Dysgonamonadaceae bacterium]|jgi:nitroreductase|nr:nitroreductase family protein [Dysgonamonadaceae bacterium]
MNDFITLITRRRSVRRYAEAPLQPSEVEQLMKAAFLAPSSKNSCPWEFVLVEDKAMLKTLAACKPAGATSVEHCALAIVVLTDPLKTEACIEDATVAATYIQLQAEAMDLGSCWVQVHNRQTASGSDSEQYVKDALGIPYTFHVGCIVTLGRKAKAKPLHGEEKFQWEKVHIATY